MVSAIFFHEYMKNHIFTHSFTKSLWVICDMVNIEISVIYAYLRGVSCQINRYCTVEHSNEDETSFENI